MIIENVYVRLGSRLEHSQKQELRNEDTRYFKPIKAVLEIRGDGSI